MSRLQAGPQPQLSKQPQTCPAPCPSPACAKGCNARGIPAVSGGSRSRDSGPSARQESGAPAMQGCPAGAPQHCQAKPSHSCSYLSPRRLTDPGNVCLGHTSHLTATASRALAGMCHVPLLPLLTLGLSLQHFHGHAWQNLHLCSLPWGNLDTVGCFTFTFPV